MLYNYTILDVKAHIRKIYPKLHSEIQIDIDEYLNNMDNVYANVKSAIFSENKYYNRLMFNVFLYYSFKNDYITNSISLYEGGNYQGHYHGIRFNNTNSMYEYWMEKDRFAPKTIIATFTDWIDMKDYIAMSLKID